ncbi:MAG: bifunctional diaminohydroxyphosphoribosylaminopyrimidine deaminase/5-amino-6-(5-phosphoribosylamino)uracil reductase RibD [Bdellovibrionaceae bacterium]|nr:bifunctional diaminohydroxyphosphoribosylaminopyrimidine deaminase/5-amino-6-(5-phosphoribosylamino)uracil reductase RibD [Pseudobdellovibrionaceae bacterium]
MFDVRCQKLISEFGLRSLLNELDISKKKLTVAQAMAIAIYEAYQGAQRVSPNPLVGCVILDSHGQFLSKGHHEVYGQAHAEINALKGLDKEQLQDATMIVTLEPCAHVGKTGSCALQIKDLPVKRVIYGLVDPFHLVAGKGAQILRDSGKEAIVYADYVGMDNNGQESRLLNQQLEILAENFLKNSRAQKPFVALKWAQSLDGKMALKNYQSQWITGELSRTYAHYLRSIYDGLIVGSGTILQDNPKLNIRLENFSKESKLVIIDPEATVYKTFESLELSRYHKKENIFFIVDAKSASSAAVFDFSAQAPGAFKNILFLNRGTSGFFSMQDIYQFCFERGMKSLLVEGGPSLIHQCLKQNAFDRIYAFVAPILMGNGLGYTDELPITSMNQKMQFTALEKIELGDDLLVTGLNWTYCYPIG